MKNGRYCKKGEPMIKVRKIERHVPKIDSKTTSVKKGYSNKLPSIKKETKTELGILDEYIFNSQSREKLDVRTENRIFKEIEQNAKVYEKEIIKFLGLEPTKESTKILANKELRSKSMIDIKDDKKNTILWESQLKKLDQQEEIILKSLQQLDVIRKVPKLLKPLNTVKKLGFITKSNILIKSTRNKNYLIS